MIFLSTRSHWRRSTTIPTIVCCAIFLMAGCVQVGPKEFGSSRAVVASPVLHPQAEPVQKPENPCPDPMIPPPIPEVAHISIEPGKPVQADAGGEALLRAYIAIREQRGTP